MLKKSIFSNFLKKFFWKFFQNFRNFKKIIWNFFEYFWKFCEFFYKIFLNIFGKFFRKSVPPRKKILATPMPTQNSFCSFFNIFGRKFAKIFYYFYADLFRIEEICLTFEFFYCFLQNSVLKIWKTLKLARFWYFNEKVEFSKLFFYENFWNLQRPGGRVPRTLQKVCV